MTLTCSSYRAAVLPCGQIRLDIETAQADAAEDHLLIPEIAELLKMSAKSVYRLSTRKKDPLPLIRGKGRPFALRTNLNAWLSEQQGMNSFIRIFGR